MALAWLHIQAPLTIHPYLHVSVSPGDHQHAHDATLIAAFDDLALDPVYVSRHVIDNNIRGGGRLAVSRRTMSPDYSKLLSPGSIPHYFVYQILLKCTVLISFFESAIL
ncbi:hypothetical protein XANCAGTX0491_005271 [Xanthoria calcicola]